jgi:hypothetical protein
MVSLRLAVALLFLGLTGGNGRARAGAVQVAAAGAARVSAQSGVPAMTLVSAKRLPPATPLEMALKVEKELAGGAGALLPFPELTVKLGGGVTPLTVKQKGFPPEFREC